MVIKNDFIELEYTARVKCGEIFDTTNKEIAKKANLNAEDIKPLTIAVGTGMVIKGLDKSLENKEINKEYKEEYKPEESFGKRNPSMIKMVPMKFFLEQKINPQRGMQLALDGMIAKVVSVSGGRVLVDLNNPLAGREVVYEFKINKKIEDLNDKINALQEFFFKRKYEFTSKDKEITFKVNKGIEPIIKMFEKQFKDILGIDIKAEVKEEKAEKENFKNN